MKRFAVMAIVAAGLAVAAPRAGAQEIETFDSPNQTQTGNGNFVFASPIQGSWASANGGVIIDNPTNIEIQMNAADQSHTYGTAYHNFATQDNPPGVIDISGSSMLQLDIAIPGGDAGIFVDLQDGLSPNDNWQYFWGYGLTGDAADDQGGLPPGYTITQGTERDELILRAPLASPTYDINGTGSFDFTQLNLFRVEDDPGTSTRNQIDFNDLSAVNVPEPASLGLGAIACLFMARRRRHQ